MTMPQPRDTELAERKQQVLIRSAELRVSLTHQVQALSSPLAVADQAVAGAQWLRTHPAWPLGAMAVLAVLRPRRALRWASRLLVGWRVYAKARDWLDRAAMKRP
jgi:hypothetical protein